MKFIAGVVVGLVLASTATVFADVQAWVNGSKLMDQVELFRLGYVAGADDMLREVVAINASSNDFAFNRHWFAKQNQCLEDRAKGSLSQFLTWAEHLFLGRNSQAASILLDEACK
jgi:hypothetical protein